MAVIFSCLRWLRCGCRGRRPHAFGGRSVLDGETSFAVEGSREGSTPP